MIKDVIVCDLDGTLALDNERAEKFLRGPEGRQWEPYFEACDQDLPNTPIIMLLQWVPLWMDIWILSGRSATVREKTVTWLQKYDIHYTNLLMRDTHDRTDDHILKVRWIDEYHLRDNVLFIIEDRQRMVNAWRKEGFTVLQCAPGDF